MFVIGTINRTSGTWRFNYLHPQKSVINFFFSYQKRGEPTLYRQRRRRLSRDVVSPNPPRLVTPVADGYFSKLAKSFISDIPPVCCPSFAVGGRPVHLSSRISRLGVLLEATVIINRHCCLHRFCWYRFSDLTDCPLFYRRQRIHRFSIISYPLVIIPNDRISINSDIVVDVE